MAVALRLRGREGAVLSQLNLLLSQLNLVLNAEITVNGNAMCPTHQAMTGRTKYVDLCQPLRPCLSGTSFRPCSLL